MALIKKEIIMRDKHNQNDYIEIKTLFSHRKYQRCGKHVDCYEWSILTFWRSKQNTFWFDGNMGAIKFMDKLKGSGGLL